MNLATLPLFVTVVIWMGVLPVWPYSRRWGYSPASAVGAVLFVLFVLLLARWL